MNERIIRMAHNFTMQTRPNDFDFHPPFPIIHTSVSWLRSNAVPLALLFRCRPPAVSHALSGVRNNNPWWIQVCCTISAHIDT